MTALKEDSDDTEDAAAAPGAGSDGNPSRPTDKPECNWRSAFMGIEGPLCDAVHMIGIAAELANDVADLDEQLLFAVNHSQELLDGLRVSYYRDWKDVG